MISFSKYLAESLDTEFSKYLKNLAVLKHYTDRTSVYIEELEELVYAGKPVDKVFLKHQKTADDVLAFANKDKAGRWEVESKDGIKTVRKFRHLAKLYKEYAIPFKKVLNTLSKGDKQEDAIAKLVKLGAELKYFNMETESYISFFDNVNEKDILFQIDKYKGLVKLNGPVDFYVVFDKGRVKKFYF